MKKTISKNEAKEKIDEFFQNNNFTTEEVKKIKRLAMKYKIRLGNYKKLFCKNSLSPMNGKIKVSKIHKTVVCHICSTLNKRRIN
mgnify:FL=1